MAVAQVIVGRAAGASAAVWFAVAQPVVGASDDCADGVGDCADPVVPNSGDIPVVALVVGAVFLGVFVFGLRAIKRQRDEGRRSKLPPIG